MDKRIMDAKFDALKSFIDRAIEDDSGIPKKVAIFALTRDELIKIITRKNGVKELLKLKIQKIG